MRRATPTPVVLVESCVGGGPMERLARSLEASAIPSRVVSLDSPESWRSKMAAGALGRLRARAGAFILFPLAAIAAAARPPMAVAIPTTNPFFLPVLLVATRHLHGKPVIALVYDLFPDAIEATGGSTVANGGISRIIAGLNRYLFARADGIVFIGARMASHARERYGEPRHWTVLETGAEVAEFSPARVGDAAPLTDLERWCEGRVVYSYVGNMGQVHDWETLAEALPRFVAAQRDGPPIGVVIAASGPGVEALRRSLSGVSPDVVRFEPPLPDRDWARLLALTHVSLVTLRAAALNTSIPSKTFSAMAAGNAILVVAPRQADVAQIVLRHDCGRVIEPGDVDGLVNALGVFATDGSERSRCRARALQAATDHYDLPRLAERWSHFVNRVLEDRATSALDEGVRRAIDLAGAAVGLTLTSPVIAAAALAIFATMGSPVMFTQERPGRFGKVFRMSKLRTMRAPAPGEEGPDADAARLTRLGRLLRSTSIDELPALWNVLRGDMSLVGPRPLLTRYLNRYSARQTRRHEVRPGVTGWAQINGRNAVHWDDRLEMDVQYVEQRSVLLDLRILVTTVLKVIRKEGIEHAGHATMPEFQGPAADRSDETCA